MSSIADTSARSRVPSTTGGGPATVQWGPDGRQVVDTFPGWDVQTAHWDGDEMLFSTSPPTGTTGAWLNIGKQGIMDSSGDIYVADSQWVVRPGGGCQIRGIRVL